VTVSEPDGTAIEVLVEGRPVDIASIFFHFQQDPYPGGLTYSLRAKDPNVSAFIEPLEQENLGKDQRRMMLSLGALRTSLGFTPDGLARLRSAPLLYWANTVDEFFLNGDEVFVRGVASPHVR
jgi:hypothetical protein